MYETAKTIDWQGQGGSLEIPQGWCVIGANFDVENPYIDIAHIAGTFTDKRLLVPKALAYYLSTHFCGSNVMRDLIREHAKSELQNTIKDALGL